MASRSAGPFVGRQFLLERHFAREMISIGKAQMCPLKVVYAGRGFMAFSPYIYLKRGVADAENRHLKVTFTSCPHLSLLGKN